MGEIATLPTTKPRRSIVATAADRYGMEPAAFEQVLRSTVVPKGCTKEQFAAFCMIAHEYRLNPVLKEIYAFPSKGGIQPIVGIDGWIKLVNGHGQCDGYTFEHRRDEKGGLVSVVCRIHRKDRSHPVEVEEFLSECKRGTDPWKQHPSRMLQHKAFIQAARYAFGFSGIMEQDEFERIAEPPQPERVSLEQRLSARRPAEEGFDPERITNELRETADDGEVEEASVVSTEPATETPRDEAQGEAGDEGLVGVDKLISLLKRARTADAVDEIAARSDFEDASRFPDADFDRLYAAYEAAKERVAS